MTAAPPSPLEEDVVALIEGALPSVWALETLLLLRRAPDRTWTAEALVTELRASAVLVAQCLKDLERAGLVLTEGGVARYAPASAGLAALCDRLENAYRERPVAVINTIAARRPDPLRGFADSFRFKGWKL